MSSPRSEREPAINVRCPNNSIDLAPIIGHICQIRPEAPTRPSSSSERRAFLKAIGVLVKLLLDSNLGNRVCICGQKPSAFQIAQLLLEKAESLRMETEGLKSMDRKITEALELLAKE